MKELTPAERRALKARAHHLTPVVMVGDAGLTPSVTREIQTALRAHELIKIRVLGDDRDAREALAGQICDTTGASPVQQIGKLLVVYRERLPDEAPKKKRPAKRKPKRRTKRSYQNT